MSDAPRAAGTPPSLVVLARVELRKMVDTRAGRWLVGILALVTVLTAAVYVGVEDAAFVGLGELFGLLQTPVSVLLPVLAILAVTGEWSQRTALSTFSLVPRRERVVAAKALATGSLVLAAVLLTLLAAAVAVLASGPGAEWSLDANELGQAALFQLLGAGAGLAFGLALQSSAPALLAYFLLPTLWSGLAALVDGLRDAADWLSFGAALGPLLDGGALTGEQWGQAGTASLVWIGVPLAVGLWRLARGELSPG